jgi:adenylyltransferase/sulfurtransferase
MLPDYSRQVLLKQIGAQGQAALGKSRALIVGLGGLGSPVMQYLAGAGVGCLGLIDPDVLDASNLHRQPIYALADVGRPKTDLARDAILKLNPSVRVETHAVRFDADNALGLVGNYDIVVDCSDNFRTKYLINDAAVLAGKPAVFASVYQYEGHLQVYKPDPRHACLRCLWPDAIGDGIVGNCAEAGVLGPVPGALGALQALVTVKILLNIGGQLDDELLLLDFMNFSTLKIKATRRAECRAPGCAHVSSLTDQPRGLEMMLDSLAQAAQRGFEVIDIRNDDEVAERPSGVRHISMHVLLADPSLLPAGRPILLLCASGKRSLATAQALGKRGIAVQSLAGGLNNLERASALQQ